MPKIRSAKLESATARLTLPLRTKPYWQRIGRGIKLGYRRNATAGTWSVEATDGHGKEWIRKFADADDYDQADGQTVLTYWQASERARQIARGQSAERAGVPITVGQALDAYERDLESNGADPANAKRVRHHLSDTLKNKCVAVLTVKDLKTFRNALAANGRKPDGVNRTMKGLRAALNLAVEDDDRITNAKVWKIALANLTVGNSARRLVLPDSEVRGIVAAARAIDERFGLVVEVLAQTGARISQAARLRVCDLQAEHGRLLMPPSRKGGRTAAAKKPPSIRTQIPLVLVAQLQEAAAGRAPDEFLLLRSNGVAWHHSSVEHPFRQAVVAAGLAPSITSYALRHSSIVRHLLRLPASLVASLHDTSEVEIRNHYGAYITDVTDKLVRAEMVDMAPATVVPFKRQATQ
jgi:integrase